MTGRLFTALLKMQPSVSSVHVSTALGNGKSFEELRDEKKKKPVGKRDLQPHDADTAKTPFPYDAHALGSLRPDQIPRFFGALTDPGKLDDGVVPLDSLFAMQDRIDPKKVNAMRGKPLTGKLPIVVQHNGRNYIADGHHRLAAQWLDGEDKAMVKIKDIDPISNALKRWRLPVKIVKSLADRQEVFGWASVATKGGQFVIDKQGDAIEPHVLENAAYDYVLNSRVGGDMHETIGTGSLIESCVMTLEKQKAMGVNLGFEGWWTGFKVHDENVWRAHKSGERAEFSIGGMGRRVPMTATED